MQVIKDWRLKQLREEYPVGTRVELIHMNDPYNRSLAPDAKALSAGWTIWVRSTSAGIVAPAWDSSPAKIPGRKSEY